MDSKNKVKSCYIHIPFCKKICSYCDFCKLFYNEKLVDKYLSALEKEIDANYKNEILETIYIGGGTPSSLNLEELKNLDKESHIILNKSQYSSPYILSLTFKNVKGEFEMESKSSLKRDKNGLTQEEFLAS